MHSTKVIKSKPVEAKRKTLEGTGPVKVRPVNGARSELRVPAVRKSRAASSPRCPQRDRCEGITGALQGATLKPSCERRSRSRSRSTAPKTTTNRDYRRATSSSMKRAAVTPKGREMSACPGQRGEQQGVRAETTRASESHKAFTVIPPDPKKRREIQRKAEAELAALEELRLSRAMAYVSIDPSSVGGCLSLEEVRLKQQQEMMQAKRKQKPVRKQLMEQTAVLKC
ncbi:epithelial-stromal interaction protein 1 [Cebidichthys violaceus]|uniref:epithelial-stromal interaction protein 1 n=1 Tax=Cebidichthys violaceus TaxID=271503 RepID=UPI0035C98943